MGGSRSFRRHCDQANVTWDGEGVAVVEPEVLGHLLRNVVEFVKKSCTVSEKDYWNSLIFDEANFFPQILVFAATSPPSPPPACAYLKVLVLSSSTSPLLGVNW